MIGIYYVIKDIQQIVTTRFGCLYGQLRVISGVQNPIETDSPRMPSLASAPNSTISRRSISAACDSPSIIPSMVKHVLVIIIDCPKASMSFPSRLRGGTTSDASSQKVAIVNNRSLVYAGSDRSSRICMLSRTQCKYRGPAIRKSRIKCSKSSMLGIFWAIDENRVTDGFMMSILAPVGNVQIAQ